MRDHLRGYARDAVIGHDDWHPENLRWRGPELIAVFDWDGVICQPEPVIVGSAAVSLLGIDTKSPLADIAAGSSFLDAYQQARGLRWTSQDYAACWAAGRW